MFHLILYSCRLWMFQNEMECKHQWIYKKDQKITYFDTLMSCVLWWRHEKKEERKKKLKLEICPRYFNFFFILLDSSGFLFFFYFIFFLVYIYYTHNPTYIFALRSLTYSSRICQIFTIKPIRCGKWIEALECRILNI